MLTSLHYIFSDILHHVLTSLELGLSIWVSVVCTACPTVSQFSHNRRDSVWGETSPGAERSAGTQRKWGGRRPAHRPAQHHGQHGPDSHLLLLGLDHPAHLQIHTGNTIMVSKTTTQHCTTRTGTPKQKAPSAACPLFLHVSNYWAKTLK